MSMSNSVYNYSAKTIDGKEKALSEYEGKAILVVNTASK
jgi:glutathione peroxidase